MKSFFPKSLSLVSTTIIFLLFLSGCNSDETEKLKKQIKSLSMNIEKLNKTEEENNELKSKIKELENKITKLSQTEDNLFDNAYSILQKGLSTSDLNESVKKLKESTILFQKVLTKYPNTKRRIIINEHLLKAKNESELNQEIESFYAQINSSNYVKAKETLIKIKPKLSAESYSDKMDLISKEKVEEINTLVAKESYSKAQSKLKLLRDEISAKKFDEIEKYITSEKNKPLIMTFDNFMKTKSIGMTIGKIHRVSGFLERRLSGGGYTLIKDTPQRRKIGMDISNSFYFSEDALGASKKGTLYDLKDSIVCVGLVIASGTLYVKDFSKGQCN